MTKRKGANTTEKGVQESALVPWVQQLTRKSCRGRTPLEQKETARKQGPEDKEGTMEQEQRLLNATTHLRTQNDLLLSQMVTEGCIKWIGVRVLKASQWRLGRHLS